MRDSERTDSERANNRTGNITNMKKGEGDSDSDSDSKLYPRIEILDNGLL